jgi:hypothetical protein
MRRILGAATRSADGRSSEMHGSDQHKRFTGQLTDAAIPRLDAEAVLNLR